MRTHNDSASYRLKHLSMDVLLSVALMFLLITHSFADRQYGPIVANESLSKVINNSYPGNQLNRYQIMVAIFRANPGAFKDGNIHSLRREMILNLPDEETIINTPLKEAAALIEEHLIYNKRGIPVPTASRTSKPDADPDNTISEESMSAIASALEPEPQVTEIPATSELPLPADTVTINEQDQDKTLKALAKEVSTLIEEQQTNNNPETPATITDGTSNDQIISSQSTPHAIFDSPLPPKVAIELRKESQVKDNKTKQVTSLENINKQQDKTLKTLSEQIRILEEQLKSGYELNTPPTAEAEAPEKESPATPDETNTGEEKFAEDAISSLEARLAQTQTLTQTQKDVIATDLSTTIARIDSQTEMQSRQTGSTISSPSGTPSASPSFLDVNKKLIALFVALTLGLWALSYYYLNRPGKQRTATTAAPFGRVSSGANESSNVDVSDEELLNTVLKKRTVTQNNDDSHRTAPAPAPVITDPVTTEDDKQYVKDDAGNDAKSDAGNDAKSDAGNDAKSDAENDAEIKINMARAYMDMGYIDSSRTILEEVLIEGTAKQKEVAQQMLSMI